MSAPGQTRPERVRRDRVRGVTAAVCVVVASLLLPVGIVTVWLREQILDTNAFVSTAGTVARDPAVQREVSDKVSRTLIHQLDVESNVRQAARSVLPDSVHGLAGPLSVGAETVIRTATAEVVASDRFEELWEVAVRGAHRNALRLAEGESVAGVETRNGRIAVDLDPIVDAVVARLPGPIAALIPPVTTGDDIVLFRSSDLASVQPVVRMVDDGWWAVPLLSLVLFAAGGDRCAAAPSCGAVGGWRARALVERHVHRAPHEPATSARRRRHPGRPRRGGCSLRRRARSVADRTVGHPRDRRRARGRGDRHGLPAAAATGRGAGRRPGRRPDLCPGSARPRRTASTGRDTDDVA